MFSYRFFFCLPLPYRTPPECQLMDTQMGLHLLSTEGLVIKRLRTYLLQCHACFKYPPHGGIPPVHMGKSNADFLFSPTSCDRTTKEMDKVFCPNCGHQTLRKVPYVLDEATGQPILLANRVSRPVSVRGTKFSLPLPKGGRHEQKIILREDELLEQTRRRKKKDGGQDIFDDDKAFLQPRQHNQAKFVVGKTRRNPNESRHRTGKRKKNSGSLG